MQPLQCTSYLNMLTCQTHIKKTNECRTPPPPGHVPPYEKWHMWTSAPQAIDIGGHVPPPPQLKKGVGHLPPNQSA